ncbi:hypothetical protein OAN98_05865, partial [Bacteroidia bacterium]|nr:hypothetical protein [Bacteroidia bacterium]
MKYNAYNTVYPLLKWVLSVLSFIFFYRSIKDIDWTNEFLPRFTSAFENYPFIFTGVFLLVILNWNFEALKFK